MARTFAGDRIVVASHNPGKIREIQDLLAPFGLTVLSAGDLGLPEPEETGLTFTDNAALKAELAAGDSGYPALADDSGLEVEALSGAPGIYSARWGGPDKDFTLAMGKINESLQHLEERTGEAASRKARFVSALALAWPDGHMEVVEGEVLGSLVWPPRGDQGFGYDPMFVADGSNETFGEADPAWKHAISHRADAFSKLIDRCFRDKGTTS
ncbi:MAG: RdgB/HAM1 family non-canonical purine NTP pyrophosphatase [Rhodospirillaceae bacterium]|jgi:XTP/dITP diphosphohydrolase|nr:RdgB/HAM1 family non-canonical purine NTP pyrophosphatase [Rhodospirillaceae bacterium]MBT6136187.1 RdgB/HAM1 family non-canonical purine NTP pyrophosphatase [Rhodospirillaceae bacterium]